MSEVMLVVVSKDLETQIMRGGAPAVPERRQHFLLQYHHHRSRNLETSKLVEQNNYSILDSPLSYALCVDLEDNHVRIE